MRSITEIIPDDLPEWAIQAIAEGQFFRVCLERDKELQDKYHQLIFEVQTKHPDESRHETALRYIRERENAPICTGSAVEDE